ncbi:MAG: hypothetical protein H7146_08275 [Burkholderiaceae bacterium]|nr:hypothetical protein [Microbacteriaceae bacterium]
MTGQGILPLIAVGDPDATACVGDVCMVPEHNSQSVVNRRIDEDAV